MDWKKKRKKKKDCKFLEIKKNKQMIEKKGKKKKMR